MKVSILIPVHGECLFLKNTLESLENANLESCEVIAVLDRANVEPQQLLMNFQAQNEHVFIIDSDGIGISNALNTGLKFSTAEFIARLDCDDLVLPERFQEQIRFLTDHPNVIVFGSQIHLINEVGDVIASKKYPTHSRSIHRVLRFQNCIAHPSVMFRKKEIQDAGGYDSNFDGAEDFELWTRILPKYKIANSKATLMNYRISESQVTRKPKMYPGELEFKVILKNSSFCRKNRIELNAITNLLESNNRTLLSIRKKSYRTFLLYLGLRNLLGLIHGIKLTSRDKWRKLILGLLLSPMMTFNFLVYQIWRKIDW